MRAVCSIPDRCERRRAILGRGEGAAARAGRGRAVQLDPMKVTVKAPGSKRLKLKCEELLSNVAFNFNLLRYTAVIANAGQAPVPEPPVPVAIGVPFNALGSPGRGGYENKLSTDVESPPPPPPRVCTDIHHECVVTLRSGFECLVLIDPPAR